MSVRTSKPWNRVEFFVWLDAALADTDIPHVSRLAEMAEISPSTISNWKTGKQRPTLDKLEAIAKVLGIPRADVWSKAGLVIEGDLNASLPISFGTSAAGTVIEPAAEDRAAIARIRASSLSKPMQDRLIKDHLDEARELREANLRRLQKQIDRLEASE